MRNELFEYINRLWGTKAEPPFLSELFLKDQEGWDRMIIHMQREIIECGGLIFSKANA